MNLWHLSFAATVLATSLGLLPAGAQTLDGKLDEYRRKISKGRYLEIRSAADRPDVKLPGEGLQWSGPGMVYVEGLIAPDGATAIRLFRLVADSLGAGSLKEDALARMFEEYSSNGRRDKDVVRAAPRGDDGVVSWLAAGYAGTPAAVEDTIDHADSSGRIVAVYAIQVGAFSVAENAEKLSRLLASKGLRSVIYDNLIDGKRLLHLVWVGRYDNREDAEPELEMIEKLTGIRGVLREQMIWRRW